MARRGTFTHRSPGLGTAGGQGRQGLHDAALDRAPRLRIAMVAEDFDEGRAKTAAEGHRRLTAPAAARARPAASQAVAAHPHPIAAIALAAPHRPSAHIAMGLAAVAVEDREGAEALAGEVDQGGHRCCFDGVTPLTVKALR